MNKLKQYFRDIANDCQTCPYRHGSVCTEYKRSLQKADEEYLQLDECVADDVTAIGDDSNETD